MTNPSCSLLDPVFRETETQWFDSGNILLYNTSVFNRPDALSLDYQTAFSYGPVETGSVADGLAVKAWRVHNVTGSVTHSVFYTRETDDGTTWRPDSILFTYTGQPIQEIDLSFSGDGRAVVCASRLTSPSTQLLSGSEVWVYWFNPLSSAFSFTNFGTGSCPRALCDAPDLPQISDVLIFYIKDSTGNVFFRQQRDAYSLEYYVPVPIPSSLDGTLTGDLSGTLIGILNGNLNGTNNGFTFGTPLIGEFIGTSSADNTGRLLNEFLPLVSVFTGSLNGVYTGSLSGSLIGTLTGASFSGSGGALNGILVGIMSGAFKDGNGQGDCNRPRTWPVSGTLFGSMNGWFTGSFIGTMTVGEAFGTMSGFMSGIMTGEMAGNIDGTVTSGSQGAFFETFLEDAVKLQDSRVALYYTQRNTLTAEYTVNRFESVLYPVPIDVDQYIINSLFMTGSYQAFVITNSVPTDILVNFLPTFLSSSLVGVVITSSIPFSNVDTLVNFQPTFLSSSLITAVLTASFGSSQTSSLVNSLTNFQPTFLSSSLIVSLIRYTSSLGDDSFISSSLTLVSGSLI